MDSNSKPTGRKTLGGLQFWTDWRWCHGWRLQRHWRMQRARILDPENRLVESGSYEQCVARFDEIAPNDLPTDGPIVLLLHGMNRTRNTLRKMERAIQEAGFETARLSYASTRQRIQDNARGLSSVVEHLPFGQVSFVGHSMGNLVVRRFLYDLQQQPESSQQKSLHRMVMIAPPNQGSKLARWLKFSLLFNVISGVGGREFSWRWDEVKSELAVPDLEFGVIAGAQQKLHFLSNPFLPGPDDWTVSLAETQLENETDRYEDFLMHGTIMKDKKVIAATVRFLKTGHFSE